MRVFNACNIIIKRRFGAFVLYFAVFMALTIIMPMMSAELYTTDFTELKPNFTVINRDGVSPLSDGLVIYLGGLGHEIVLYDRRETLQDASFYNATDYIVILPQGFRDAFIEGRPLMIETVATTESAKGLYVDLLINQYFNQLRLYRETSDMGEDELVSAVLGDLSVETRVVTKRFGAGAPVDPTYQIYNRMLSYILIVLILVSVSNFTSSFRRTDIRMRNLCAPLKPRSMSGQQILCGVLVSLAAWILLTLMGVIVFGSSIRGIDGKIVLLTLLNTLIMTLVALSIAALVSLFVKSPNSQNAIANFVSLGLCFLGGVFVPMNLLGEGILAAARFTPIYWHTTALGHIFELTSFSAGALAPIWQAMLTQLIFAAAFICLSLVIGKHMNQSEKSFGSIRTELEA